MFLQKIRFKPGYRRLWIIYRSNFKKLFNLNMRYQYKLTKFVQFFKHYAYRNILYYFELQLLNILHVSQIFPLIEINKFFIQNALVMVNGITCTNNFFLLRPFDVITCVISSKYYLLYRFSLLSF